MAENGCYISVLSLKESDCSAERKGRRAKG